MIELKQITKIYNHRSNAIKALNNVDLKVEKGQIYGVVGQSGAGKSTLIRCINLLERPTNGKVYVNGEELTSLSPSKLLIARHNIGMIFQHFNLLSSRNVFKNIALPLELIGAKNINEKVKSLLNLTGLENKAKHYPAQLSGGQKQRVAIARALANSPQVLLSDEATSALDPQNTEAILQLLNDINQKLNLTILMITHEMEVVKKICHNVALMENGTIIENNSIENFFTQPMSKLGKNLIAQIQQLELPPHIAERLQSNGQNAIVKLSFKNNNVNMPLLSQLTRKFDIDINIIQAKVEHVRTVNIGYMLAELMGAKYQIDNALQFLRDLPIETEILGYVEPIN